MEIGGDLLSGADFNDLESVELLDEGLIDCRDQTRLPLAQRIQILDIHDPRYTHVILDGTLKIIALHQSIKDQQFNKWDSSRKQYRNGLILSSFATCVGVLGMVSVPFICTGMAANTIGQIILFAGSFAGSYIAGNKSLSSYKKMRETQLECDSWSKNLVEEIAQQRTDSVKSHINTLYEKDRDLVLRFPFSTIFGVKELQEIYKDSLARDYREMNSLNNDNERSRYIKKMLASSSHILDENIQKYVSLNEEDPLFVEKVQQYFERFLSNAKVVQQHINAQEKLMRGIINTSLLKLYQCEKNQKNPVHRGFDFYKDQLTQALTAKLLRYESVDRDNVLSMQSNDRSDYNRSLKDLKNIRNRWESFVLRPFVLLRNNLDDAQKWVCRDIDILSMPSQIALFNELLKIYQASNQHLDQQEPSTLNVNLSLIELPSFHGLDFIQLDIRSQLIHLERMGNPDLLGMYNKMQVIVDRLNAELDARVVIAEPPLYVPAEPSAPPLPLQYVPAEPSAPPLPLQYVPAEPSEPPASSDDEPLVVVPGVFVDNINPEHIPVIHGSIVEGD